MTPGTRSEILNYRTDPFPWEFERMKAALKGEKSRDKLRRQVRHFVEFLEKEGVVGAPK